MRLAYVSVIAAVALAVSVVPAHARKCKKDAVQVGDACIDTYEASAWELTDPADNKTISKIQNGKIDEASDLTGKATQRGDTLDVDDFGAGCPDNGNGCTNLYAVSIPGVMPSGSITWFQAAACRNAGKRLATNQEWTLAALGTPDTGAADNGTTTCNTDGLEPLLAATGSRSACVSDVGAFDMVGNVREWVADWVPLSTAFPGWGGFSDDAMALAGASTVGGPGALIRGGDFNDGTNAGPLEIEGNGSPKISIGAIGFRCARDL
jgi:formylglycine-generating enzyme required for sulfatase activity